VPLRLIDSSVWITYLRPKPDPRIVEAIRDALEAGEVAIATPIVIEVLSGIRDPLEYEARETDFRALTQIQIDGEVGYIAARIGKALGEAGSAGKTVDLMLAGAAIRSGAELWSLYDDHYEEIHRLLKKRAIKVSGTFRIRWLPEIRIQR
jgi:predicted nucleic acid-binding protein